MAVNTGIKLNSDGRAVTAVRGIKVSVIVSRFLAGETVPELADDLDVLQIDIEDALRYWLTRRRKRPAGMEG